MRRYLFDTGVAGDYVYRRKDVPNRAAALVARGDRIGIVAPVLGELWGGVEGSQTRERNEQRMRHALNALTIWPYEAAAAREYGRVVAELKRIGRPMQQIDVQIAAVAFTLGNSIVVSYDSDLAAIPGLTVENWAT